MKKLNPWNLFHFSHSSLFPDHDIVLRIFFHSFFSPLMSFLFFFFSLPILYTIFLFLFLFQYDVQINMKLKYDETMSRIATTINLSDAHDCDLIIEAIVENENIKIEFYERLGPLIKPSAIFASNTSSLPVTTMAIRSGRPDKFVGLHFFNPVQVNISVHSCFLT